VTACDSSTYSMFTCTVFELHLFSVCLITHRYWYWYWVLALG